MGFNIDPDNIEFHIYDKTGEEIMSGYGVSSSIIKKDKYNWVDEKPITQKDITNLEDTYKNDKVLKKTLGMLMDDIDAAIQIGDKRWFNDLCKEYRGLKMEGIESYIKQNKIKYRRKTLWNLKNLNLYFKKIFKNYLKMQPIYLRWI